MSAPPELSRPYELREGDALDLLAELDAGSVDAVVCDPPYGLEFMGKAWDTFRVTERHGRWSGERSGDSGSGFSETAGLEFDRPLPSFGGKRPTTNRCQTCGKRDAFKRPHEPCGDGEWKNELVNPVGAPPAMLAFQYWVTLWAAELLRVLKPGGHVLAFGGTRTYHRLTAGLEDAGFEIRDSLHWIYGEGFPKSLNVGKAIDRVAGAEREPDTYTGANHLNNVYGEGMGGGETLERGAPVTAEAAEWEGWGTTVKPAHEPIVLARKPLDGGRVVPNVLAHGVGAVNVRACSIGFTDPEGRWPANVILGHSIACKGSGARHTETLCVDGCPVKAINEQSGETVSRSAEMPLPLTPGDARGAQHGNRDRSSVRGHDDAGGAARFFYVAKATTRERVAGTVRNLHPTVKPVALMRWLVRLVTPPGGLVLDPFAGSGSTGCAAMAEGVRFLGIELDAENAQTARERVGDWAFANGRLTSPDEALS